MSQLRPDQIARRDQAEAHASEHLARGDLVLMVDPVDDPSQPCCWCDCPDVPDSPHMQEGYVCGDLCHEPPVVIATLHNGRRACTYRLCERHRDGPVQQLAALGLVSRIEVVVP